jgi:hypothetical protein
MFILGKHGWILQRVDLMSREIFDTFGSHQAQPEIRGMWDDTTNPPELMLAFDTDDAEFARGFQCGMVWQLLYGGVHEFEIPIYLTNVEMAMRMAEAAGYAFKAVYEKETEVGDPADWIMVTFTDTGSSDSE